MADDEMTPEEFAKLLELGKVVSARMLKAGGKNSMQTMAMAMAICLAEFARQNSGDPIGQHKIINDIANSAGMVLDWARATPPQGLPQ